MCELNAYCRSTNRIIVPNVGRFLTSRTVTSSSLPFCRHIQYQHQHQHSHHLRHSLQLSRWLGTDKSSENSATESIDESLLPMSDEEKRELDEAARIIFDHRPWSPVRTGNKVLRKKFLGPLFTSAYSKPFADVLRSEFPEYLTEKEDRRKQKLAYMRRRGKGPPKKGQGKRAGKGKK